MKKYKNNSFSIIVPALNEEFYIERCLKSLVDQNYEGEYEVLIVDNGSVDKTKSIAEKYNVKVLSEPKKGISNALINGCNEAKGNILVFTDADSIVPNDWLSKYDTIFDSDENIIAAGGMYEFFDKRFLARVFFNKILKPVFILFLENLIHPKYPTLPCVNMAVREKFYAEIGGFNPRIKWGQEIDLTMKLAKHGKIHFDKDLLVQTSFRRYAGNHNNSILVFLRSMKELVTAFYRSFAILVLKKSFDAQEEIRNSVNDRGINQ